MNQLRKGKRLLKTAVAVYITAEICYLLGWPMIFAVIAAIVSIEPTVHASVSKGWIRIPSTAIGAAFAMLFDAWLGPQPITFALSALATIYVCYRLGWRDTIVVATLTAVNMIPLTDHHFLINFFIRLGTTMTGVIVSALVNYLLFRPNYTAELRSMFGGHVPRMLELSRQALRGQHMPKHALKDRSLSELATLLQYHIDDLRFRRTDFSDLREIAALRRELRTMQRMQFYIEHSQSSHNNEERRRLRELLASAVLRLQASSYATHAPGNAPS
ncbi:aromatic acid exporter family protein [Paenibacillus sp. J5C_2022]|uniref:FUSC family protein n=1 Tax=Paenibacillus sp. J5C2022 TaxID=2977129 RepID=UPI0021D03692|nr:aromatic acid exporter family protein [Paenibacillus sp. J5C2022]MCU6708670.1 aromatic acid exporter family protein [Paenibacillus sp. J5C2022]